MLLQKFWLQESYVSYIYNRRLMIGRGGRIGALLIFFSRLSLIFKQFLGKVDLWIFVLFVFFQM